MFARRVGAVDIPSGRRIHTRPTPRLGGLAIMGAVLVPSLYYLPADPAARALLVGAVLVGVLARSTTSSGSIRSSNSSGRSPAPRSRLGGPDDRSRHPAGAGRVQPRRHAVSGDDPVVRGDRQHDQLHRRDGWACGGGGGSVHAGQLRDPGGVAQPRGSGDTRRVDRGRMLRDSWCSTSTRRGCSWATADRCSSGSSSPGSRSTASSRAPRPWPCSVAGAVRSRSFPALRS